MSRDPIDDHCSVWITEDFVELIHWLGWNILHVQDTDDKVGNGFTIVIGVEKPGADDPSRCRQEPSCKLPPCMRIRTCP